VGLLSPYRQILQNHIKLYHDCFLPRPFQCTVYNRHPFDGRELNRQCKLWGPVSYFLNLLVPSWRCYLELVSNGVMSLRKWDDQYKDLSESLLHRLAGKLCAYMIVDRWKIRMQKQKYLHYVDILPTGDVSSKYLHARFIR
jgi:hypothetical protein